MFIFSVIVDDFFKLIAYFKTILLLFDECLPHSESTLFNVILLFCFWGCETLPNEWYFVTLMSH